MGHGKWKNQRGRRRWGMLNRTGKEIRKGRRNMGNSSASFGILVQVHLVCKWEVFVVIKAYIGIIEGRYLLPFTKYQAASHHRASALILPSERNAPVPSYHLTGSLFYKPQQKCHYMCPWPCPQVSARVAPSLKCHPLGDVPI